jgi:hypothetical protein
MLFEQERITFEEQKWQFLYFTQRKESALQRITHGIFSWRSMFEIKIHKYSHNLDENEEELKLK